MFENVNPKFLDNAKAVENELLARISKITQLSPDNLKREINNCAFEISQSLLLDLSYLAKKGGLTFISLLAVTLNKILNPEYENEDNDESSINWILNAISDLKYIEVEEIVETAQSLLEEAHNKASGENG
jgi:hypothetical protein